MCFFKNSSDKNNTKTITSLIEAVKENNIEQVESMIATHPEKLESRESDLTPLMIAIQNSNLQIVNLLIQAGCDTNNPCPYSPIGAETTPLMVAAYLAGQYGVTDIVDALIKAGCNLNLTNSNGSTALMIAVRRPAVIVTKTLIDAGCNLNLQDKEGNTALMMAILNRCFDTVNMLIDAGCDLSIKNLAGLTATDIFFTIHTDDDSIKTCRLLFDKQFAQNDVDIKRVRDISRNKNRQIKSLRKIIKKNKITIHKLRLKH